MENDKIIDELVNKFPKGIIEELLILPELMRQLETKVQAFKLKIVDKKRSIDYWELRELRKISEQTDENNKKVFSNEILRNAELQRRKDNSQEIKEIYDELFDGEQELEKHLIDLRYYDRRLKSLKSVINICYGGK